MNERKQNTEHQLYNKTLSTFFSYDQSSVSTKAHIKTQLRDFWLRCLSGKGRPYTGLYSVYERRYIVQI